jgi:exosortase/archaeosortase family protein
MKRYNFLTSDLIAAAVLAGWALLVFGESSRRGVDLGTLGMGAAALGFFFTLGSPWSFQPGWRPIHLGAAAWAAIGLVVGLATDLLLPISLAWSALLWAWLRCRVSEEARPRIRRLLLLTALVFPWADLDIKPVHWAMRVSAAGVVQPALTWCGLPTTREGTLLRVAGQAVEISEHCAGGETLHAMLVVGLAAAYVYLNRRQAILPWLPVLCGFAWLANTLRVLLIAVAAGCFPHSRYFAWVHDVGGWLVVALMTGLCVGCFAAWNRFGPACRTLGRRPLNWWTELRPRRGESAFGRAALWSLLVACVGVGLVWRLVPLPAAQARLRQLPAASDGRPVRDVALTESEVRWLGEAQAVKRVYHCGGREFLVTAIDGTRNRRAVHDPMYCWTITAATDQPLPGGSGRVLRVLEEGIEKEILFWFSDGVRQHASPARYWLQASWRRATLGRLGAEPLLLIVEPVDAAPVNWFRVLDGFPWLLDL